MSSISGLGSVDYAALAKRVASTQKSAGASASQESFKLPDEGSLGAKKSEGPGNVDQALRDLSASHNLADKMVMDLASGRDLNMHNTMVALEQADIALKYTVQLRNRALSAYEELMRIQV